MLEFLLLEMWMDKLFSTLLIAASLIITSKAFAIIGGEVAPEDDRSGIVNIYIDDPIQGTSSLCTASKVSKTVLLTAAHCFDRISGIGSFGFSNSTHNPNFEFFRIKVNSVKKHPSYRGTGLEKYTQNDFALITVDPTPQFAMLKILEISYDEIPSNQVVEYWGFGCQKPMTEDDDLEDITKKFAKTRTLSKNSLINIGGNFPDIFKNLATPIYQSKILTIANKMDSSAPSLCDGDSGGPVMINGKIVGIISSGVFNDLDKSGDLTSGIFYIGLHSRVSVIQQWIEANLNL